MKNISIIIAFLFVSISHAQQDFKLQLGKKEFKKNEVTFHTINNEDGTIVHCFKYNNKVTGPMMIVYPDGKQSYMNYNKKHELDGTFITTDNATGTIELATYRKGKMNGPAFTMANGKMIDQSYFKDDRSVSAKEGKPKSYFFGGQSASDYFEGFTVDESPSGIWTVGYFMFSKPAFPAIAVYPSGNNYMGQFIQGVRKEFGVFFFKDDGKYVGFWHNGDRQGPGFYIDENGNVVEKGYYEKDKLKIAL